MVKINFKTLKFIFFVFLLLVGLNARSQSGSIFTFVNTSYNNLDIQQKTNYQILKQHTNIDTIYFGSINQLSIVQDSGKVVVDLPFLTCSHLVYNARQVTYSADSNYKWYGEIIISEGTTKMDTCFNGSLWLVNNIRENGAVGLLTVEDDNYQIYELGSGLLAFCKLKPGFENQFCGTVGEPKEKPTGIDDEDCVDNSLRILVLYSPAAQQLSTNITGLANLCISQTNSILNNSEVYAADVTLAGVELLPNFVENTALGDMNANINSLVGNSIAQGLRIAYQADAVVLLVSNVFTQYNGMSATIGAADYNAYAMVDITDAANNHFTFAHEIFHLLNARHLGDLEGTYNHGREFYKWSFNWFNGFFYKNKTYRTFMCPPKNKVTFVPHLSNPNVKYNNIKTGNINYSYNAKKVNEWLSIVPNYYISNLGLYANIHVNTYTIQSQTPFELLCNKGAKAYVTPHCGKSPYSHTWYESLDGINYYYAATGSNFNLPQSVGTTFFKVITTDADNNTVTNYGSYYFGCGESTEFMETATKPGPVIGDSDMQRVWTVSPNPINSEFAIQYSSAANEQIQIALYKINGKALEYWERNVLKGNGSIALQLGAKYPAGTYILSVKGKTIEQHFKLVIAHE